MVEGFLFWKESTAHVDAVLVYWSRSELLELISRFLSVCVSTAASKQRRPLWREAAMREKSQSSRASKSVLSTRFILPRGAGMQISLFLGGTHQSTGQGPDCIVVSGSTSPIDVFRRTPPTLNSRRPRLSHASGNCDPLTSPGRHWYCARSCQFRPIFTKPSIPGSEKTRPSCLQPSAGS